MRKRMNRRHIFGIFAATLGSAIGSARVRAEEPQPMGDCYWRVIRTECFTDGTYEYRCYRCCDLTGCNDTYCEWRRVGPC